jgi:hypothetical protein
MQLFLLTVLKNTGVQLTWVLGSVVFFGAILSVLSRWTANVFAQVRFPQLG